MRRPTSAARIVVDRSRGSTIYVTARSRPRVHDRADTHRSGYSEIRDIDRSIELEALMAFARAMSSARRCFGDRLDREGGSDAEAVERVSGTRLAWISGEAKSQTRADHRR